jgi:hypothetical protein
MVRFAIIAYLEEFGLIGRRKAEKSGKIGSKLCARRKCGQCPVEAHCDKTKGVTFRENLLIWKA